MAWVADGNYISGDVLRDHAACADHGVITDGNTRQDDGSSPDPAVAADADRVVDLIALLPQRRIRGMRPGSQDHMRAKHGSISHIDMGIIHNSEAEIGINKVSEMNMSTAPVGMKRRLHIAAFTDFSKHLLQ